jgi:hypothetical protein
MAQINKPSEYFNTVLYTGTGSGGSNRQITGVGFQPDFTWVKTRGSSQEHVLSDSVRGATKALDSQATTAEETTNTRIGAFISDGFQLGSGALQNRVNENGVGLVAWNWKANGAGVSNTAGSIASTVSANTTSGFSIVSFTGTGAVPVTVGHGLGVVPEVLIIKNRTNAYNWAVYHKELGNTGGLFLNTTSAFTTNADLFNNTSPTNLVVTFSNSTLTNQGSANHIMYAFNSVKGFSKFGKYTGNGNSTNGPFIYTGFLPSFVMIKCTSTSSDWFIWDSKREPNNLKDLDLYPNNSSAEDTALGSNGPDFLSNGFKFQSSGTTSSEPNVSGASYIYMAFAENPLVGTNNIPTTAR